MKNIVQIKDDNLLVSIVDIKKFSGVSEKAIISTIRKNAESFSRFGNIKLTLNVSHMHRLLNEAETTFLLTLLKNTKEVIKFKSDLVFQFYSMKNQICDNNKNLLQQKENQLKIANKQTEEAKRKTYAHTRDGDFQCVTNIIRDTEADISAETLNKILLSKGFLKQKEVLVKKYISNEVHSTTSIDGAVLMHYDTVIKVLKEYEVVFEEDSQMTMDFGDK